MSFRFLTAGESHGKALVGILEGIPAGLPLIAEHLHAEGRRRKLGYGRGARMKIETDEVEILSGVRHGLTLGSPISLVMWNRDWGAWENIMEPEPRAVDAAPVARVVDVPRPGHADFVGGVKYAHVDMRNVLERASARETAMRVALGTVARRLLEELGVSIASRVRRIGSAEDLSAQPCPARELNARVDDSPVRAVDAQAAAAMVSEIEAAKKLGDTLGGVFEVIAEGVPLGLGSYAQWDRRLEAEIGRGFLSLNAIKGVEIGLGFAAARLSGSQVHDELRPGTGTRGVDFGTNHSGGIDGGMSSGQPIVVRAAMKPLATLMEPLGSVDLRTGDAVKAHVERSDVCAVPAAAVIGESLLALALVPALLEKFGGDSLGETRTRVEEWRRACLGR